MTLTTHVMTLNLPRDLLKKTQLVQLMTITTISNLARAALEILRLLLEIG